MLLVVNIKCVKREILKQIYNYIRASIAIEINVFRLSIDIVELTLHITLDIKQTRNSCVRQSVKY